MSSTYRKAVLRTANTDLAHDWQVMACVLGITGEAGEIADNLKKVYFHGHEPDHDKLIKEIGDVRFYLEWLCHLLGVSMEEVEARNIAKLARRYPEGFSTEASVNRQPDDK